MIPVTGLLQANLAQRVHGIAELVAAICPFFNIAWQFGHINANNGTPQQADHCFVIHFDVKVVGIKTFNRVLPNPSIFVIALDVALDE